jgi:hypothetical protein
MPNLKQESILGRAGGSQKVEEGRWKMEDGRWKGDARQVPKEIAPVE